MQRLKGGTVLSPQTHNRVIEHSREDVRHYIVDMVGQLAEMARGIRDQDLFERLNSIRQKVEIQGPLGLLLSLGLAGSSLGDWLSDGSSLILGLSS